MTRNVVADDHAHLNMLLDRFSAAETAVKAALAVPPVPTPSAALGEALASRDRAALAVCRFLTAKLSALCPGAVPTGSPSVPAHGPTVRPPHPARGRTQLHRRRSECDEFPSTATKSSSSPPARPRPAPSTPNCPTAAASACPTATTPTTRAARLDRGLHRRRPGRRPRRDRSVKICPFEVPEVKFGEEVRFNGLTVLPYVLQGTNRVSLSFTAEGIERPGRSRASPRPRDGYGSSSGRRSPSGRCRRRSCAVCHGTGRIRDGNYPQIGPDGRLHRPVTTSPCHHCR